MELLTPVPRPSSSKDIVYHVGFSCHRTAPIEVDVMAQAAEGALAPTNSSFAAQISARHTMADQADVASYASRKNELLEFLACAIPVFIMEKVPNLPCGKSGPFFLTFWGSLSATPESKWRRMTFTRRRQRWSGPTLLAHPLLKRGAHGC